MIAFKLPPRIGPIASGLCLILFATAPLFGEIGKQKQEETARTFQAVTERLEQNGHFYLVWNAQEATARLHRELTKFSNFISDLLLKKVKDLLTKNRLPVESRRFHDTEIVFLSPKTKTPFQVELSWFQTDDLFVFCTHSQLADTIIRVKNGSQRGLNDQDHFKALAPSEEFEANQLLYVSPRLSESFFEVQKAFLSQAEGQQDLQASLFKLLTEDRTEHRYFGTMQVVKDGLFFQSRSTTTALQNLTLPMASLFGGFTGMRMLPAVVDARGAAEQAKCMNNLKQIGLAVHNFEAANPGKYPQSVSGIEEYLPISDILVCPRDNTRRPAEDWQAFNPDQHMSYQLFFSRITSNYKPQDLLIAECPVHGIKLYLDGHVEKPDAR